MDESMLVVGGWWLVVGGWWLVVGGWLFWLDSKSTSPFSRFFSFPTCKSFLLVSAKPVTSRPSAPVQWMAMVPMAL